MYVYIGANDNSSCYKVALQKIKDASHNDVHVYPEWYDAIYAFINAIERKALSTVLSYWIIIINIKEQF
jgi:hypothetical protein